MNNKYNLRLGIVIIGYKNKIGIRRLLDSLDRVEFDNDELLLIFSIDRSNDNSVERIALDYKWNHGKKIVKTFEKNLGLKNHIIKCGDYLDEYHLDGLVVLEDDIYLAPNAYSYVLNSVEYYRFDDSIAGISLYKHEFNIFAKHPFIDYKDGNDVYFMQYAQSWGQIWLKKQWASFKKWLINEEWRKLDPSLIPDNVKAWKNSWLKYHIMYCVAKDLYFVYPRVSLTTNYSDAGVHGSKQSTNMQVALDNSNRREWNFVRIKDSKSVYDVFFQNIRLLDSLGLENVFVDLYSVRNRYFDYKYLLTMRSIDRTVVKSWGLQMRPIEENIIRGIDGDDIRLYDLNSSHKNKKKNWKLKLYDYDLKGIRTVCFQNIQYNCAFICQYFKNKIIQMKKNLINKLN